MLTLRIQYCNPVSPVDGERIAVNNVALPETKR
jgi:hypothetical protein